MSRLLALSTCLLLAASPVTSYAQSTSISVLVEAGTIQYHEEIAKEYMALHPDVKVEFRSPVSDYSELVRQTLLDAQTNSLADVGFFGNFTLVTLAERGIAQPLDARIAAESDWSSLGYDASTLSVARLNDTQYGIPFAVSLPVIFYNADLVEKAGGNPDSLPQTWDEIIALSAKIDDLGTDVSGLYIRMEDAWIWQCMVFGAGGEMISADGKTAAFDDPAGQAAIAVLARAGSEAKMPAISWTQSRQQFSAGQLGILVGSSAIIEGLKGGAGDRFEIKAAPFPNLTETSKLPAGGNTGVVLATDPTRQDAAWDYLKFATGPVGQTIMVKATGYMPVNSIAVSDNALLGEFYANNPLHKIAIDEAKYTTGWFAYPGENGLRIDEIIVTRLLDVIYQRAQPEEMLTSLVAEINGLL
jgi:multiple sugar transport system substrate-binding protein